jgi:hypothetical protein
MYVYTQENREEGLFGPLWGVKGAAVFLHNTPTRPG